MARMGPDDAVRKIGGCRRGEGDTAQLTTPAQGAGMTCAKT